MAFSNLKYDASQDDRKSLEKELIKSMAGCYTVDFKFAETFAPEAGYEFRERYHERAKEYVFVVEETADKISLQHLLRVGNPINDGVEGKTTIIKHWRQDWIYENQELLSYVKDFEWQKSQLSADVVQGTWTQQVYQVDDAPRYEGFGRWTHHNGRHYWDGVADAPLPRRDRTTRDDYNVLVRDCRIEIFDDGGWMIDQDNRKMLRDDSGKGALLCMEKGLETFTPDDYDAAPFEAWWVKRADFWADVRRCWAELRASCKGFKFELIVDDVLMYDSFFKLAEEFADPNHYDSQAATRQIKSILKRHIHDYA